MKSFCVLKLWVLVKIYYNLMLINFNWTTNMILCCKCLRFHKNVELVACFPKLPLIEVVVLFCIFAFSSTLLM